MGKQRTTEGKRKEAKKSEEVVYEGFSPHGVGLISFVPHR